MGHSGFLNSCLPLMTMQSILLRPSKFHCSQVVSKLKCFLWHPLYSSVGWCGMTCVTACSPWNITLLSSLLPPGDTFFIQFNKQTNSQLSRKWLSTETCERCLFCVAKELVRGKPKWRVLSGWSWPSVICILSIFRHIIHQQQKPQCQLNCKAPKLCSRRDL